MTILFDIARSVRYFLIVVFAGVLWPLTFKLFARMKIRCLDNFGLTVASVFSKELRASIKEKKEAEKKELCRQNRRKKKNKKKKK